MSIIGIDVSKVQGNALDWPSIAAAGIRFAILKATQGASTKDSSFDRNYDQAVKCGIAVGAYHWLSPQSDPKAQAAWTRSVLAERSLPAHLAVDFEDQGFKALGRTKALEYCETYVREMESQWPNSILVYTGKWFWNDAIATDSPFLAGHPLWHAEYPSTRRGGATQSEYQAAVDALPSAGPHVAAPWASRNATATLWQFDGDHGLILPQKIDADFDLFLGDENAFLAFIGAPPALAPFVPTVTNIQRVLIASGLDIGSSTGEPDGVAGPKTTEAICSFQRQHGLTPDGIVGPKTLGALEDVWNAMQTHP